MAREPAAPPDARSATMRGFVQWIRAAAPYVHAFRGRTFVIAFGGKVVADEHDVVGKTKSGETHSETFVKSVRECVIRSRSQTVNETSAYKTKNTRL